MTRTFRPMKGEAIEEHHLDQFSYPLLVAGKMDGIRGAVLEDGVYSNRIKLLPSGAVQSMFGTPEFQGLDGEVIVGPVGAPDVFKRSTSFVMSRSKPYPEDGVHFYVFDDFTNPTAPYGTRYDNLRRRVAELQAQWGVQNLHLVPQHIVHNKNDVLRLEEKYLSEGLEGIMIRSLEAPYKYGRGTIKQQSLVKFKRFDDFEATVIGFEELYHNQNEATTDARGLTKRTSHQENQVAGDTLGAIVLQSPLFAETFKIGTGFTQVDRDEIWRDRDQLMGATVTVSYQKVGVDVKPRFPKFKGFRKD